MKKKLILLFLGFIIGLIYSNLLIKENVTYSCEKTIDIKEEVINEQINEEKIIEEETIIEDTSETTEQLEYTCPFDEITCKIQTVALNYKIDWKLAVAISKHETGVYTSYAFKELNNVGGMMYWDGKKSSLKSFDTLEIGIDAFIKNLKNNYINMGLITIEQIQPKYAPIGASNDPNNLNSYWVSGVYKYYNQLNGK